MPCQLNTWTGEILPLSEYTATEDGYLVNVDIAARGTTVIGLASPEYFGVEAPADHATDATVETYYQDGKLIAKVNENGDYQVNMQDGSRFSGTVSDVPAEVSIDEWNLSVEKWSAGDNSAVNPLDTKKETIEVGTTAALPWSEIGALGADVSGIGRYTATFTLDSTASGELGAMLYLEDLSDTYNITINGHKLNGCDQIDYKIDLGSYVQPGENTITIEVASLLSNAVGKSTPSGLMGEVQIVPYVSVALEPSDADKTILNKVIAYAEAQKADPSFDNVILDVQTSFTAALDAAKEVAANAAAGQSEVDQAWTTLMTEIHKLGFVRGDKTSLGQLIALANSYNDNIDRYTPSTAAVFVPALTAAQATYDDGNAMQGDVEKAEAELLDAMMALRYRADKSVLEAVLAQASKIDTAQYTAESVAAFNEASAKAEAVNNNADATQQEVNEAADNLQAAIDGLVAASTGTSSVSVEGDNTLTIGNGNAKTGETAPIAAVAVVIGLAAVSLLGAKKRK